MKSPSYNKIKLQEIEEMFIRFITICRNRELKFARGEWGVSPAPKLAYPKLIDNWVSEFGSVDIGGATLLAMQPRSDISKAEAFVEAAHVTSEFAHGLFHGWDMTHPSWNRLSNFKKQYAQGYKLGAALAKRIFDK